MKKAMVAFSMILICVFSIRSQDLSDLTLIAHYPLSSDNLDVTSRQEPMTLINTPFEEGGIYCNGIYINGTEENGCHAITPQLKDFSFEKLAISATVKITSLKDYGFHPVFVGGSSWRWLTVWLGSDSLIGFETNNEYTVSSNTWHTVTATYDSASGNAVCYLDGTLVDAMNYTIHHGNNKTVGITHTGMGLTFKGYLKDLKIYSIISDLMK